MAHASTVFLLFSLCSSISPQSAPQQTGSGDHAISSCRAVSLRSFLGKEGHEKSDETQTAHNMRPLRDMQERGEYVGRQFRRRREVLLGTNADGLSDAEAREVEPFLRRCTVRVPGASGRAVAAAAVAGEDAAGGVAEASLRTPPTTEVYDGLITTDT